MACAIIILGLLPDVRPIPSSSTPSSLVGKCEDVKTKLMGKAFIYVHDDHNALIFLTEGILKLEKLVPVLALVERGEVDTLCVGEYPPPIPRLSGLAMSRSLSARYPMEP